MRVKDAITKQSGLESKNRILFFMISLVLLILVGSWIGFWVISDSGIFKAGLTEMVIDDIRATSLGVQSAIGYSI